MRKTELLTRLREIYVAAEQGAMVMGEEHDEVAQACITVVRLIRPLMQDVEDAGVIDDPEELVEQAEKGNV